MVTRIGERRYRKSHYRQNRFTGPWSIPNGGLSAYLDSPGTGRKSAAGANCHLCRLSAAVCARDLYTGGEYPPITIRQPPCAKLALGF